MTNMSGCKDIMGDNMFETIIYISFVYLCISLSLFFIFGLVVLDNDSKFIDYIIAMLLMPFIVIGGLIEVFKEEREKKNK